MFYSQRWRHITLLLVALIASVLMYCGAMMAIALVATAMLYGIGMIIKDINNWKRKHY